MRLLATYVPRCSEASISGCWEAVKSLRFWGSRKTYLADEAGPGSGPSIGLNASETLTLNTRPHWHQCQR